MKNYQRGFATAVVFIIIIPIVVVGLFGWRFIAESFAPAPESKTLSQLIDSSEGSVIGRYEKLLNNSGDYTTIESKDFFSNNPYIVTRDSNSIALRTLKEVEQVKLFGLNDTPQYALIKYANSKYDGKLILYKVNNNQLTPLTIGNTVFEQVYNSSGGDDIFKVYIDILGNIYIAGSFSGTNQSKLYTVKDNIVSEVSAITAKGSIRAIFNNKGEFYVMTYGQQSDGKYKAKGYFIKDAKIKEVHSVIGNYTDEKGNWYQYDYSPDPMFSIYPSRLYKVNGNDRQLIKRKDVVLCPNFHGDMNCRNNILSDRS